MATQVEPTLEVAGAWRGCAAIVEAAAQKCVPIDQVSASQSSPDHLSELATSFAALSAALTWGSIIIALVGILGGLAWGRLIVNKAENEARTASKEQAHRTIERWLDDEAPAIIRSHVEKLRDATLGDGDDDAAADAMGKAAG